MKKKRLTSLLLAMVMILALSPTAFAVYSYHMDVTVEEPVVGAKPAATAVSRNNKDTGNPKAIPVSETPQVKWSGELDANGVIIRSVYGPDSKFYTLDGQTIDNKSLPKISTSTTASHYRVTRMVYDYYRADDPSLGRFPNCTELWLSPKCNIDGILRSLDNVQSYQDKNGDFIREDCTIFIPDSLYPNGPAYNGHPAPGCKVMLYSGSDVYAAARAGKSAARDWCTSHSYTYRYISEDRRYTYPGCGTDARFYYSCSKCGKCERNPNHTFYPTVGSFDIAEDGGKDAHSFETKVVTDEHFLGLNPSGERVYLYACDTCGKDRRQAASASEKKFWAADGTGAYYNFALSKTVVGKENGYDSYAISKDTYIAAKQNGWAKEPMAFMNALGLISGTGKTTLSPNGTCTIEQAIAVASRSLYADRTGWYQKNDSGSDWLVYGTRVWVYYKNGEACYRDPEGFELTGVTFSKGLRPIKDR